MRMRDKVSLQLPGLSFRFARGQRLSFSGCVVYIKCRKRRLDREKRRKSRRNDKELLEQHSSKGQLLTDHVTFLWFVCVNISCLTGAHNLLIEAILYSYL